MCAWTVKSAPNQVKVPEITQVKKRVRSSVVRGTPEQVARAAKMRTALQEKVSRGEIRMGRAPSLKTLQKRADKDAREKFLAFASTHVLPVGDALVKRALEGDVQAMKEFFDRTWGKAPQSVDMRVGIFSLLDLGKARDADPLPQLDIARPSIDEIE